MTEEQKEIERTILLTVGDLVSDFLYYDRKGDEDLPQGIIDQAVIDRPEFLQEIIDKFKDSLIKNLILS